MAHFFRSEQRRRLIGFYAVALLLTVASTTDALPLPGIKTVVIAYAAEPQPSGEAPRDGQGHATVSISLGGDLVDRLRAKADRIVLSARMTFAVARSALETAGALRR